MHIVTSNGSKEILLIISGFSDDVLRCDGYDTLCQQLSGRIVNRETVRNTSYIF